MGTAREFLYDAVYGDDAIKYQTYTQLAKPIRGYPEYYKLTDELAFVDGPDAFGGVYRKQDEFWFAQTDGNKIYVQKESNSSEALVYEHTAPVDNVSLEFDQSGRVMFTYESEGTVFLRWYDPVPQTTVTFEVGQGVLPKLTTDNYKRIGPVDISERLLFYLREGNLYARRQDDRYTLEYLIRDFSGEAIDFITVKPTGYGNICCVVVIDGPQLVTVSSEGFNLDFVDGAGIYVDTAQFTLVEVQDKVKRAIEQDNASIYLDSGLISLVEVQDKVIKVFAEEQPVSMYLDTGAITNVDVQDKVIKLFLADPTASIYLDTGIINQVLVDDARILLEPFEQPVSIYLDSGSITGVSVE